VTHRLKPVDISEEKGGALRKAGKKEKKEREGPVYEPKGGSTGGEYTDRHEMSISRGKKEIEKSKLEAIKEGRKKSRADDRMLRRTRGWRKGGPQKTVQSHLEQSNGEAGVSAVGSRRKNETTVRLRVKCRHTNCRSKRHDFSSLERPTAADIEGKRKTFG